MNPLFIILGLQILAYIICIYTHFYTRKKVIERTYLYFKNKKVINPSPQLFNAQLYSEESRVDIPPTAALYLPLANICTAGIVLIFVSGNLLFKLGEIIQNHFNHKIIQSFVKIQKIDPQYLPTEYNIPDSQKTTINNQDGKVSLIPDSSGQISLPEVDLQRNTKD